MADIVKGLKNVWMRGMEAIGDTASNIANNTKYKVQEMNLINRRHEILSDFGTHAYALWQSGLEFPEELHKQLEELSHVDETLATIRAERLAYLQTVEEEKAARAAAAEEAKEEDGEAISDESADADDAEEEAPVADGDDAAKDEVPVIEYNEPDAVKDEGEETPYTDPIADLMDEEQPEEAPEKETSSQVRELGKKVNRAIDSVQDKVSRLGKAIDRSVQNLAKVVLQNDEKENNAEKKDAGNDQP